MKLAIIVTLIMSSNSVFAITPFQAIYNETKGAIKIRFAYGVVNGTTYYRQNEYNSALADATVFAGTAPVVTSLITPTSFELNLTTCTLNGFKDADSYLDAQTQVGIMQYLDELWLRIKTLQDSNQNNKAQKTQSCYDYLSNQAKILP